MNLLPEKERTTSAAAVGGRWSVEDMILPSPVVVTVSYHHHLHLSPEKEKEREEAAPPSVAEILPERGEEKGAMVRPRRHRHRTGNVAGNTTVTTTPLGGNPSRR
jgi:hypothetical protein